MIKELMKKYFGPSQDEFQPAQATQEEVEMIQEKEQTTLAADMTAEAELVAQLASQAEQLKTLQAQFEAAQTALAALEAEKASLQEAAKAKVQATRSEKLSAILGDEKGVSVAASLAALDDEAFDVVYASYAANFKAEAESEMFQEKGVAAEATPAVEVDEVQRLAASLAAKFKS